MKRWAALVEQYNKEKEEHGGLREKYEQLQVGGGRGREGGRHGDGGRSGLV